MAKKTRGRPKKAIKEEIIEAEEIISPPEPQINDAEIASVKRIADLRNLYDSMVMENIHSISDIEVKIQREEINLANIKNKK